MKAISLWQPWASLLVAGTKKIETRHWRTDYRGRLAIHAAQRFNRSEGKQMLEDEQFAAALTTIGVNNLDDLAKLPYGALIGSVRLYDCVKTDDMDILAIMDQHKAPDKLTYYTEWILGNYDVGRYGWMCDTFNKYEEPMPYKGAQGFFIVPDEHTQGVLTAK